MVPLDQTCQVKKAWLEKASDKYSRIFTTLMRRGGIVMPAGARSLQGYKA